MSRSLTEDEVKKLFAQISNVRDETLCRLLLETGLREAEGLSIRWHDVLKRDKTGIVDVLAIARRHCKGGKTTLKSSDPNAAPKRKLKSVTSKYRHMNDKVKAQLWRLYQSLDPKPPDDRFVFITRQFRSTKRPMTTRQFGRLVSIAVKGAMLDGKVATHSFRHTYARRTLKKLKQDPAVNELSAVCYLQHALDHKNLSSTQHYIDVNKQKIVEVENMTDGES